MDRTIDVRTPESVRFSYDLAGLGSRFLAVCIDLMLQIAVLALIVLGLILAAGHVGFAVRAGLAEVRFAQSFALAAIGVIVFIVFFGYFILFEALWNGRTPGKNALGIRVVRDGGYPLDFGSSFVRNIVRIGEVAAGFYLFSAVSALLSSENKRLGDYAAATIVVRDKAVFSPSDFATAPAVPFSTLRPDEQALVARFVARRNAMSPDHRARMAAQIANLVRPRVSRDLAILEDEDLLAAVVLS